MTEMKMVTPEQYAEKLGRHQDDEYHLILTGEQVPILHGLIALAADHPEIEKSGWPTKRLITQVRWWCRQKFSDWGFTPEEVEYLDKTREDRSK